MNASGDYAKAAGIAKQVIVKYPHDSFAMEELARTLRLEGHFSESLQMAQQAYAENPYNLDAYTQAENSLLGLDRYDAAAQLQAQVEKLGLARPGGGLTPAYLEGRQDTLDQAIQALTSDTKNFRPDWNLGLYYDNVGHLAQGAEVWRSRAKAAKQIHGLESAAGFLLSQGALDRAMLGDCKGGLAMAAESDANPQGPTALFNVGMAYALCGNSTKAQAVSGQLQQNYPQSFAARGFYIADITAANALHDNNPQAALDDLTPARPYDLISLTPYLRGSAHVQMKRDIQVGIVDFQTVLSHRGVPFIVGSVVYPVAEIGVARAFAETGDVNNSAGAYKRFLQLWKDADPNQPLVTEAHNHAN
jgi:serine/threonine-protein kinase